MVVNLQCNLNCLGHTIIWNINICKLQEIVFHLRRFCNTQFFKNYYNIITSTFNWAFESTLFLSAYLFVYCYLISTWTSNWFLTWICLNYIDNLVLRGGTESLSFIFLNVAEADEDGFFLKILHTCYILYVL